MEAQRLRPGVLRPAQLTHAPAVAPRFMRATPLTLERGRRALVPPLAPRRRRCLPSTTERARAAHGAGVLRRVMSRRWVFRRVAQLSAVAGGVARILLRRTGYQLEPPPSMQHSTRQQHHHMMTKWRLYQAQRTARTGRCLGQGRLRCGCCPTARAPSLIPPAPSALFRRRKQSCHRRLRPLRCLRRLRCKNRLTRARQRPPGPASLPCRLAPSARSAGSWRGPWQR